MRERLDRLAELFETATALPKEGRAAFLDAECGDDRELREELESLLDAQNGASNSLAELAGQLIARAAFAVVADARPGEGPGLVGTTLGRYEVRERLGRGGMGVVFRAHDGTLDRDVALKFLPSYLGEGAAQERLRAEARAASALDHPNIAVVHEIGVTDADVAPPWGGRVYMVMGYYEGDTLRRKIERGPLPIDAALGYAESVAAGLERAHEAGVIHRDVKPANVIVTHRGGVKVIDFGVANVAGAAPRQDEPTPGTVAYMSPEQTRGDAVDARSDVWSLAVVLYEMLTGARPFGGDHEGEMMRAIRAAPAPDPRTERPEIPAELAALVLRCLAKDPADRPGDMGELRAALAALRTSSGTVARQSGGRPALATALVLLVLAAASFVLLRRPFGDAALAAGPSIDADGIAVMPFQPGEQDSALATIGRDLVFTLSSTLGGVEGVTTADPLTTLSLAAVADGGPMTRERARGLAARAGVGRAVLGAVRRTPSGVRVDAELLAANGEPIGRASASGPIEDVAGLTDSLALAFLRALWRLDPSPAPSLGALSSNSVPALTAYLRGERALAGSDMAAAVAAFERAFEEDSTYWWAYWRSIYPRTYRESSGPADTAIIRRVLEHTDELRARERLLVESWAEETLTGRLAALRRLTDRYGLYGPGWYDLANLLTHEGPYLGTTLEDARVAMKRAATAHPAFSQAWGHLLWITLSLHDVEGAAAALRGLEATIDTTGLGATWLRVERFRYQIASEGVPPPDSLARLVGWITTLPAGLVGTIGQGFAVAYMPAQQIDLNAGILARPSADEVTSAVRLGNALAWIQRGDWARALDEADRLPAVAVKDDKGARRAYAIAVAGVLFGHLDAREASRRRPVAPLSGERSKVAAAEVLWLDGVLAYATADGAGIERALTGLKSGTTPEARVFRESLAALSADLAGDREHAARLLVESERRTADARLFVRLQRTAPFAGPLHRLLAARWLGSLGREAEAASMLAFLDANGTLEDEAVRRSVGVGGVLDRARLAEALGHPEVARGYYELFLRVVDRPQPSVAPLVRTAREGLARLEG